MAPAGGLAGLLATRGGVGGAERVELASPAAEGGSTGEPATPPLPVVVIVTGGDLVASPRKLAACRGDGGGIAGCGSGGAEAEDPVAPSARVAAAAAEVAAPRMLGADCEGADKEATAAGDPCASAPATPLLRRLAERAAAAAAMPPAPARLACPLTQGPFSVSPSVIPAAGASPPAAGAHASTPPVGPCVSAVVAAVTVVPVAAFAADTARPAKREAAVGGAARGTETAGGRGRAAEASSDDDGAFA